MDVFLWNTVSYLIGRYMACVLLETKPKEPKPKAKSNCLLEKLAVTAFCFAWRYSQRCMPHLVVFCVINKTSQAILINAIMVILCYNQRAFTFKSHRFIRLAQIAMRYNLASKL